MQSCGPPGIEFETNNLDKGSSLTHRSINTILVHLCAFLLTLILPIYFWRWSEICILRCSICYSVSKYPEDSWLSEHHPTFLEVVGDFTDTSLLRFIFTAFMICLSSTAVVFSADQVVLGFQTLDFSMPFVFPIALIYFLFSFSIQIAYFSLKVSSSSSSWFVCVIIECKIQK